MPKHSGHLAQSLACLQSIQSPFNFVTFIAAEISHAPFDNPLSKVTSLPKPIWRAKPEKMPLTLRTKIDRELLPEPDVLSRQRGEGFSSLMIIRLDQISVRSASTIASSMLYPRSRIVLDVCVAPPDLHCPQVARRLVNHCTGRCVFCWTTEDLF